MRTGVLGSTPAGLASSTFTVSSYTSSSPSTDYTSEYLKLSVRERGESSLGSEYLWTKSEDTQGAQWAPQGSQTHLRFRSTCPSFHRRYLWRTVTRTSELRKQYSKETKKPCKRREGDWDWVPLLPALPSPPTWVLIRQALRKAKACRRKPSEGAYSNTK